MLIATGGEDRRRRFRRFAYWRSASAARELFSGTDWIDHLDGDVIHLSGITLQLAPPKTRQALVDKLDTLRKHGARISFDTNYRPAGWRSADEAAAAMDQISRVATVVFATLDDETAVYGSQTAAHCADRLAGLNPIDAARVAVTVAGSIVVHPGAIIPADVPLLDLGG